MTEPEPPAEMPAGMAAMLGAPLRAQAALTAETLRRLNAPVLESLAAQRELGESLATAAEQIAALAQQVEWLARRHADAYEQARAAMEPYLRYVEWLAGIGGAAGTGGYGGPPRGGPDAA